MHKPIQIDGKLSVAKRLQRFAHGDVGAWQGPVDDPAHAAVLGRESERDDSAARAVNLLNIIRSLEEMRAGISKPALHALLHEAILGCGFRDEAEALRAILKLLYPEVLGLTRDVRHSLDQASSS